MRIPDHMLNINGDIFACRDGAGLIALRGAERGGVVAVAIVGGWEVSVFTAEGGTTAAGVCFAVRQGSGIVEAVLEFDGFVVALPA